MAIIKGQVGAFVVYRFFCFAQAAAPGASRLAEFGSAARHRWFTHPWVIAVGAWRLGDSKPHCQDISMVPTRTAAEAVLDTFIDPLARRMRLLRTFFYLSGALPASLRRTTARGHRAPSAGRRRARRPRTARLPSVLAQARHAKRVSQSENTTRTEVNLSATGLGRVSSRGLIIPGFP